MAAHDHTGNIGFWRKYADDSLATDSYFDDAERVRTKVDLDGAKDAPPPNKDTTQERRFPVRALSSQHAAERIAVLNEVPFELDPVEPPLGREALMDIVFAQRDEVKGASSRRAAKARPQHPDKETKVKHVPEFDDSALKKMEAGVETMTLWGKIQTTSGRDYLIALGSNTPLGHIGADGAAVISYKTFYSQDGVKWVDLAACDEAVQARCLTLDSQLSGDTTASYTVEEAAGDDGGEAAAASSTV